MQFRTNTSTQAPSRARNDANCSGWHVKNVQGVTKYVKGGEKGLMDALLTKGPMTGAADTSRFLFVRFVVFLLLPPM